jgi:UrcA family protein
LNYRTILAVSVALCAGFGAAQAAPAKPDLIKIAVSSSGLDLNSAGGVESFKHRMKAAALKVCMESGGIDNTLAGEYLLDDCVGRTVKAAMAAAPAATQVALAGGTISTH